MATKKKTEPTELRRATTQEIADKLKDAFAAVATERADRTEAEAVMSEVIQDLEAQKREITMKLLGLDNRWNKWEVDHCNGRQSPISEYINKEGKDLVRDWINQAVKEVFTADVKDKFMKQCKTAITKELSDITGSYEMRQELNQLVTGVRMQLLRDAAKELRAELGLPE